MAHPRRSTVAPPRLRRQSTLQNKIPGRFFLTRISSASTVEHKASADAALALESELSDGSTTAFGRRTSRVSIISMLSFSRGSQRSSVAAPLRAWFLDSKEDWSCWLFGHSQSEEASIRRLGNQGSDDKRVKRIITELRSLKSRRSNFQAEEDVATMLRDSSVPWSFFDIFEQDIGIRNLQHLRQIRPFSRFACFTRAAVTAIGAFSVVYTTLLISYWDVFVTDEAVGQGTLPWRFLQVVDVLCDLIYLLATLSRLVTGIVDVSNGVEICLPERILWKVLNSSIFWTDLLTCFPWTLMATAASSWFPRQLALVKVLRSGHFFERSSSWLVFQQDLSWVVYLLLSVIWMGGHLLSCVYYVLILSEFFEQGEIQPRWGFFKCYFFCYRTCVYLLLGEDFQHIEIDAGVRHKDVEYLGYCQNLFLVIWMPVGFLVSALVFSQIIVVVQQRSALETIHIEHENELRQTMASYDLPSSLQLRLLAYYSYEKIHQAHVTFEKIFSNLSPQLNFELRFFLFYEQVTKVPLFIDCQPRVLRELVLNLNDKLFLPGDYVCRFGDKGEEMYFICKGRCSVLTQDMLTLVLQLGPGEHFGEIAVIMGQRRNAFVRADGFVLTASLTKDSFEDIMKEFPEELRVIMSKMSAHQLQKIQSMGRSNSSQASYTLASHSQETVRGSLGVRPLNSDASSGHATPLVAGATSAAARIATLDSDSSSMTPGFMSRLQAAPREVLWHFSERGSEERGSEENGLSTSEHDGDIPQGAPAGPQDAGSRVMTAFSFAGTVASSADTGQASAGSDGEGGRVFSFEGRVDTADADGKLASSVQAFSSLGPTVPRAAAAEWTGGGSVFAAGGGGAVLGALPTLPSLPSSSRHSRASSRACSPFGGSSPIDRKNSGCSGNAIRKDLSKDSAAVVEIKSSTGGEAVVASNSNSNNLEVMGQPAATSQRSASGQMPSASGSRSSSGRTSEVVLPPVCSEGRVEVPSGSSGGPSRALASAGAPVSGGPCAYLSGGSDAGNKMAWAEDSSEAEGDRSKDSPEPLTPTFSKEPSSNDGRWENPVEPLAPSRHISPSPSVRVTPPQATTPELRPPDSPVITVVSIQAQKAEKESGDEDNSESDKSNISKEAAPKVLTSRPSTISKFFGFIPGSNRSSVAVPAPPTSIVPSRDQSPTNSTNAIKGWRASITSSMNLLRLHTTEERANGDSAKENHSSQELALPVTPKNRPSKVGVFFLGTAVAKLKGAASGDSHSNSAAPSVTASRCSSPPPQAQTGEERGGARDSLLSSSYSSGNSGSRSSSKHPSRTGSRKGSKSPSVVANTASAIAEAARGLFNSDARTSIQSNDSGFVVRACSPSAMGSGLGVGATAGGAEAPKAKEGGAEAREGESCQVEELRLNTSVDGDVKNGSNDTDSDDSSAMTSKPRWMAARKIYKANKDRIDAIKRQVEAGTRQPPTSMFRELKMLSKSLDELVAVQLQVKKAMKGLENSCSNMENDLPEVCMLWEERQSMLQRDGYVVHECLEELKTCIEAASFEVYNAVEDTREAAAQEIDLAAEALNIVNDRVDSGVELASARKLEVVSSASETAAAEAEDLKWGPIPGAMSRRSSVSQGSSARLFLSSKTAKDLTSHSSVHDEHDAAQLEAAFLGTHSSFGFMGYRGGATEHEDLVL